MDEPRKIRTPLDDEAVESLRAGNRVLVSGTLYAARDAAHARMAALLDECRPLPFPIRGAVLYYVGPSPAPPGRVTGAAGPTTSTRMDAWTPRLLSLGLKGMIGKGARSQSVRDALVRYKGVYFGAVGGAAALLSRHVREVEVIAWPELGPEALQRMVVEDLPVTVIDDAHGGDLYREGREKYRLD